MSKLLALWTLLLGAAFSTSAQVYETNVLVETYAGTGDEGYADGEGAFAMFGNPEAIAVDASTNVYVFDYLVGGTRVIRKIDASRRVTTICTNTLYVNDMAVDATGIIGVGSGPEGAWRYDHAASEKTIISWDTFLGVCKNQNATYITKLSDQKLYKVFNGYPVLAQSLSTSFSYPQSVASDIAGNLYICQRDGVIRKQDTLQNVTTVPIYGQMPNQMWSVTSHGDSLFVTGRFDDGSRIRRYNISNGQLSIVAGSSPFGAYLRSATGPDGRLYIADRDCHRIKRVTFDVTPEARVCSIKLQVRQVLTLNGEPGRYHIEGGDGFTSWTRIATIQMTNSPQTWIHTDDASKQHRFYRAIYNP